MAEYVRRYSGRRLFRRPRATALQAVDRLKTLHFLVMTDGPVSVGIEVLDFLQAYPNDLQAVGRDIRAYLAYNRPRKAFTDLSSAVNCQLVFDDEDIARYDTTSQKNAPPQTPHAYLTLLLAQYAQLKAA